MNPFKRIFLLEFKRSFKKLNFFILAGFFLICLLYIQTGIHSYKVNLESIEKFKEVEKSKVDQYTTYTQYGAYGFRLLFVPSVNVIPFINSGLFSKANTLIDSGERLRIYNPLKGAELFEVRKNNYDFGGIIIIFGSLILLFYGFETFTNFEYLKFLSSFLGRNITYFSIIGTRLIILSIVILMLFCCAYLLLIVNKISFPLTLIIVDYVILVLVISSIFYLMGTIFGTIKRKNMGIATLLVVWVFLTYFAPMLINSLVWEKSSSITPIYQLEYDKLKLLMNFERKVLEKMGRLDEDQWNRSEVHDLYHSYLGKEFNEILAKEKTMMVQMKRGISNHHNLSLFFPTTFYRSVTDEIGSRGYLNLMDFYEYGLEMKVNFFLYYAKKKYFSNRQKVQPFIEDDKNLFVADSRLPENFAWGMFLNFLYSISLAIFVSFRLKRIIHGKVQSGIDVPIDIKEGKLNFLLTDNSLIKDQVYNFFYGIIHSSAITIEGNPPQRKKFVYLPSPDSLPHIPINTIQRVLMGKRESQSNQQTTLLKTLFSFAVSTDRVIIMNDSFRSLNGGEIVEIKHFILNKKLKSLYISKNEYLGYSIADNMEFGKEDHTVKPVRLLSNL